MIGDTQHLVYIRSIFQKGSEIRTEILSVKASISYAPSYLNLK